MTALQTLKNSKWQKLLLMETPIQDRKVHSFHPKQDVALARRLSERLRQKFGSLVKTVMLHQPEKKGFHHSDRHGPLFLSVILDDVSQDLDKAMISRYIKSAEKIVGELSNRFTVKNIRLSQFWQGIQSLNPTYTSLLREAIPLHDKGFVTPLQMLLRQGRIKPTYEAMGVYFTRTQITMRNANDHMLQAVVDLYWATIDVAHALLMHYGYLPPTPSAVAKTLKEKLVPKKVVTNADCLVMEEMYTLYKQIMHKQLTSIDGNKYDVLLKKTQIFVRRVGHRLVETGAETGL